MRHTEKHFDLVDCPSCLIAPACQVTNVFAQATRAFLAVLDQYTLADMMVRRNQLHRLFSAASGNGTGARRMKHPLASLAFTVALIATSGNVSLAQSPYPRIDGYGAQPESGVAPDPRHPPAGGSVLVYDRDYPFIHYSDPPVHNDIARLQQRIDAGTVKLTATPQHGYLESILKALNIDPDSQTLVFSKTSLQIDAISAATPRAIYFNDDTYVAWVQKTGMLEIVTMDADRGPVFYTLSRQTATPPWSAKRCAA